MAVENCLICSEMHVLGQKISSHRKIDDMEEIAAGTLVIKKDNQISSDQMVVNPVNAMKLSNVGWMDEDHATKMPFEAGSEAFVAAGNGKATAGTSAPWSCWTIEQVMD